MSWRDFNLVLGVLCLYPFYSPGTIMNNYPLNRLVIIQNTSDWIWPLCFSAIVPKQSMMLDADGSSLSPGTKPHICEHCAASFRSSYHLRRHVLIHTGSEASACLRWCTYFLVHVLLDVGSSLVLIIAHKENVNVIIVPSVETLSSGSSEINAAFCIMFRL